MLTVMAVAALEGPAADMTVTIGTLAIVSTAFQSIGFADLAVM